MAGARATSTGRTRAPRRDGPARPGQRSPRPTRASEVQGSAARPVMPSRRVDQDVAADPGRRRPRPSSASRNRPRAAAPSAASAAPPRAQTPGAKRVTAASTTSVARRPAGSPRSRRRCCRGGGEHGQRCERHARRDRAGAVVDARHEDDGRGEEAAASSGQPSSSDHQVGEPEVPGPVPADRRPGRPRRWWRGVPCRRAVGRRVGRTSRARPASSGTETRVARSGRSRQPGVGEGDERGTGEGGACAPYSARTGWVLAQARRRARGRAARRRPGRRCRASRGRRGRAARADCAAERSTASMPGDEQPEGLGRDRAVPAGSRDGGGAEQRGDAEQHERATGEAEELQATATNTTAATSRHRPPRASSTTGTEADGSRRARAGAGPGAAGSAGGRRCRRGVATGVAARRAGQRAEPLDEPVGGEHPPPQLGGRGSGEPQAAAGAGAVGSRVARQSGQMVGSTSRSCA